MTLYEYFYDKLLKRGLRTSEAKAVMKQIKKTENRAWGESANAYPGQMMIALWREVQREAGLTIDDPLTNFQTDILNRVKMLELRMDMLPKNLGKTNYEDDIDVPDDIKKMSREELILELIELRKRTGEME